MKILLLTTLALIAFAAYSDLARLALSGTDIDAVSYTLVRLVAAVGVLMAMRCAARLILDGIALTMMPKRHEETA